MLRRCLLILAFPVVILSCGNSTPPTEEAVTTETSTAPTVGTEPSAETIMPKDQVEHTTEANPEVIDEDKMAMPDVKPKTPTAQATASKPAPPKATKPAATTASTSPAPNGPVTAPAAAPAKEMTAPAPAPPTPSTAMEATEEPKEEVVAKPAKPDHAAFNSLLGKYVNAAGNVNYGGLKNDEAKLDTYLAELSENAPQSDWSRSESMAFWINAYNANTLKLILKNYPVKSITDLHGGKPWDVKWINIGGKTYSLNNIEHDIIRPRYKDARIHFAVNCAAASCPPLPNKAFTAANLNSLLESRTKSFIRNGAYNTITADKVMVSKIFDWYGEDFGDLKNYLNKYATTEIPAGTDIEFKEYDWALNKQ
ncbi:DUF547 domain-containing protein [Neolewinella aurantiaca]|nr:DUF547 domain-containing protein [Neolewinella aurantiaca]